MSNGYSIGVARVLLGGTDLGSLTGATLDLSATTLAEHRQKVHDAMIMASGQKVTSLQGTLQAQCEELCLLSGFLEKARKKAWGERVDPIPFVCTMPVSPATFSGLVMPLPQFSISTAQNGFATFGLRAEVCGPIEAQAHGAELVNGIIAKANDENRGAQTVAPSNLCGQGVRVEDNGVILGTAMDSTLEVTCQVKPIYRGLPAWATDYVVDSVSVVFTASLEAFDSAVSQIGTDRPIRLVYTDLGGNDVSLDLGGKCLVVRGGMKSSASGWNSRQLRITGTEF